MMDQQAEHGLAAMLVLEPIQGSTCVQSSLPCPCSVCSIISCLVWSHVQATQAQPAPTPLHAPSVSLPLPNPQPASTFHLSPCTNNTAGWSCCIHRSNSRLRSSGQSVEEFLGERTPSQAAAGSMAACCPGDCSRASTTQQH